MADVFLSYKSEDRGMAELLARGLEHEGISVWCDRHIAAGRAWREVILRELRRAKIVIAAWSRHTEDVAATAWMLNEADEALRLGLPVIPVLLEPCEAPFGYRHLQAADLSTWRGETNHPEWREVLSGVRGALGATRAGSGPTPATPGGRAFAGVSSVLLPAALLGAVMIGWRHVAAPRPPLAAPTASHAPVSAPVRPQPEPVEPAASRWAVADGPAEHVDLVAFVGPNGLRGAFSRARDGHWIERHSEAGRVGLYHVNRENADVIILHDSDREVRVRIDLKAGRIAVKGRGEDAYQDRYTIVAISDP